MKSINLLFIGLGLIVWSFTQCTPASTASNHHNTHNHDSHEGHDHGDVPEYISYTRWTQNHEFYLRLEPLTIQQEGHLEIYISPAFKYAPVKQGHLELLFKRGDEAVGKQTVQPDSNGLFDVHFTPQTYGYITLYAIYNQQDTFKVKGILIAKDAHSALHLDHKKESDQHASIFYAKDEMRQVNLQTATTQYRAIGKVIPASGHIQPANTDLITITAKKSGVVHFRKKALTIGSKLKNNEIVFTVLDEGITNDPLERDYLQAQTDLQLKTADLERQKQLFEDKIIGKKAYDEAKAAYEKAKAQFENIEQLYLKGKSRHLVRTTTTGFVAEVLVQEGQFIEAGQPLATVLKNAPLQVKVDVAPKYRQDIPNIHTAKLIQPYNEQVYNLEKLNGKVHSYSRLANPHSHYTSMFLQIDAHPDLLPGALVEVYLQTQKKQNILTIPKTALLEEMGSYVVFVQKSGETFEKRVLQTGITDGQYIEVLEGLSPNDRVVTNGILHVKLASMASAAPAHGHVH